MKKHDLLFLLFGLVQVVVHAQEATIPPDKAGAISGERYIGTQTEVTGENHFSTEKNWNFLLNSDLQVIRHSDPEVSKIKEYLTQNKKKTIAAQAENARTAEDPEILLKFEGPWMVKGTPPDLSFAVSTTGNIVALNNDGIEYYNTAGSYLGGEYWSDFYSASELSSKKYDPRILFDSESNRFVMVLLHGSKPDVSKVLLAISYSDDPKEDGWYYYTIKGDLTNSNLWFDYPNLGMSANDIFITGNLYDSDGKFSKVMLMQIDKSSVYAKDPIKYFYYTNLSSEPFGAFTLFPVSYGLKGNYGPGMYLVSNRSSGSDKLRLWYIDKPYSSGNPTLYSYPITVKEYSVGGNAGQYGTSELLDVGDCRILSGFYLNGTIHVVHNTSIDNGWSAIDYHRINVKSQTAESTDFGLSGSYDYAYPAVGSYANNPNDKSVIIAFLRSGDDIYPQCRVVHVDNNMDWSGSTLVQAGDTYVDLVTSTTERWGDYITVCRQFVNNAQYPVLWMTGMYGGNVSSPSTKNTFRSKIAKIFALKTASNEPTLTEAPTKTYPVPIKDIFNHEFQLADAQWITIELVDLEGKMIRELFKDFLKAGKHKLSFTVNNLTVGTYILTILGDNNYKNEVKVVVVE